jgi:creatinine amidohydrolase/Fe(II)-dependent formamide hydrolase-like protein
MNYPGTISVSEDTFERLLTDICASLRVHGFRNIVLLGDSFGNQRGMQRVAKQLTTKWAREKVRVHFLHQYYNYDEVERWLAGQGIRLQNENVHDDFIVTAQLLAVNSNTVRMQPRLATGTFCISGLTLSPADAASWGSKIIEFRVDRSVQAIREAIQRQRAP